MKRQLLFLGALLMCLSVMAQKLQKNELKQLQAFLNQPAMVESTNAAALKVGNMADPSTWEGVKIENGHVVEINWSGKKLAGNLNLTGFSALTHVNVSNNRISSLTVDNNPALVYLNAGRNRLSNINVAEIGRAHV